MLKKKFLMMGFVVVLLLFLLCGCAELNIPSSDKIEVEITATASVFNSSGPVANIQVRFDFDKTGGESFTLYSYTDYEGVAVVSGVGYNLQKSQHVVVEASLPGTGLPHDQQMLFYHTLKTDMMGEYYKWTPSLSINMDV